MAGNLGLDAPILAALEAMLNELESHMLVTVLAPLRTDRRGWSELGMKRVNMDINPIWYRKLCAQNESKRKVRRGKMDTRIKRANVLATLRALVAGIQRSKYDGDWVRVAKERVATENRMARASCDPF